MTSCAHDQLSLQEHVSFCAPDHLQAHGFSYIANNAALLFTQVPTKTLYPGHRRSDHVHIINRDMTYSAVTDQVALVFMDGGHQGKLMTQISAPFGNGWEKTSTKRVRFQN